jgi:hypothetical protein
MTRPIDDFTKSLTPRLTGAGARSAQGTNTGHENGEAMASVGVRVEPTVRFLLHRDDLVVGTKNGAAPLIL